MVISRIVNINGIWARIELSPEEVEKTMQKLRDFNKIELKKTIELSKELNETFKEIDMKDFIKTLFSKSGLTSYTFLQEALNEKIHNTRKESLRK